MAKRNRSLSLEAEAIERAEAYGKSHGTNLSALVNAFLKNLPLDTNEHELTPVVRRLLGLGSSTMTVSDYHKHLDEKYSA